MKVNRIQNNSMNFKAQVNSKFIEDVRNYYTKRMFPYQLEKFNKSIERIKFYGFENTLISHHNIELDGQPTQILCLSNPLINKKEAAILKKSNRFLDFIDFINNLTNDKVIQYEEELAKL